MNDVNLEQYLKIINEEKKKKGLDNYTPLYPMLRYENNKLYIGVLLTLNTNNVWDQNANIKPEYWALIDPQTNQVISINQTEEKDFVIGKLVNKNITNNQKEISKYTVKKTLQYQEYLIKDIKDEQLPLQKKLANILGTEIIIDKEKIKINDYIFANFEKEIKSKIKELIDILINSKYTAITLYYDNLFNQILKEYNNTKTINQEKIKLCIEIMNNYYEGIIGIDNFFNI